MNTCKTCQFSRLQTQPDKSFQRRCCAELPKTAQLITQQGVQFVTFFPAVEDGWWCAHFEPELAS